MRRLPCSPSTSSNTSSTSSGVTQRFFGGFDDGKRFLAQANEANQARYYREVAEWAKESNTTFMFFEAFDEPWKGSHDPMEPEKHWGLFKVDRTPKLAMRNTFADLVVD